MLRWCDVEVLTFVLYTSVHEKILHIYHFRRIMFIISIIKAGR